MRVLIACEKSRRVASAFEALGHNTYSCDILPAEVPGNHIQDDVLHHLNDGWDLMIAHPDCTYLANSGVRWLGNNPERFTRMVEACQFFNQLLDANIPLIAVENPIQHKYARQYIRKYDQIIQPWYFGDAESKATCLWLKGLPLLIPLITDKPLNVNQSVWREGPSPERRANRSRTFRGIANAMGLQWGQLLTYLEAQR